LQGSKWGVKLGGLLACFGVVIQTAQQWIKRDAGSAGVPKL
jgi:hypothetical protein